MKIIYHNTNLSYIVLLLLLNIIVLSLLLNRLSLSKSISELKDNISVANFKNVQEYELSWGDQAPQFNSTDIEGNIHKYNENGFTLIIFFYPNESKVIKSRFQYLEYQQEKLDANAIKIISISYGSIDDANKFSGFCKTTIPIIANNENHDLFSSFNIISHYGAVIIDSNHIIKFHINYFPNESLIKNILESNVR